MKMILAIAVLFPVAVHAECLQWGRAVNGGYRACMMDDAVNRNPVIPETDCKSVMGCSGVTISNTPMPKCPDGYSLILRDMGKPACARDIIDPQ